MTYWSSNPNTCFEKERRHCCRHTHYPHSSHRPCRKKAAGAHRCHKTAIGLLRGNHNFTICYNHDGFLAVLYFVYIHSPVLSLRLLASVCGSKVKLGQSFSLIREKFSWWDSFQWRDTGDLQDKGHSFKHQLYKSQLKSFRQRCLGSHAQSATPKTDCKAKIRKKKINLSLLPTLKFLICS
jgi:hypothetical protein